MANENFNLQRFIISVVIIGVILVIGIYITSSIEDVTMVSNTAGTNLNESVTFDALDTPQSLAVSALEDGSCTGVTYVANGTTTGNYLLNANFTISECTIVNATSLAVLNAASDTVLVSYTYLYTSTSDASNAANDVVDALATGTSWISILVIVGFAVIILTMLTSGLGTAMAGRKEEVPYY